MKRHFFILLCTFATTFSFAQKNCQVELYTTLFGGDGSKVCAEYDQHSITLREGNMKVLADGSVDMGGAILGRKWTFTVGENTIVCTPKERQTATHPITKGTALVTIGNKMPVRYDYVYDADEETVTIYKKGTQDQVAMVVMHW